MRLSFGIKLNNRLSKILFPFILILWFLGLLLLLHFHVGPNLITGEWITFTSPDYCYTFQYPGRWRSYTFGDHGSHGKSYLRADLFQPKLYFWGGIRFSIHQKLMHQPDLEMVVDWSRNDLQSYRNISELEEIVLDTKPALRGNYINDSSMITEIMIAREFDALILQLSTREQFHNDAQRTFQGIVDTFLYDSSCRAFM